MAAVLAGVAIWFLMSGDADKPYIGPPPPVEFEIKGFKVVSSVPFHGRIDIRDSRIIPPPAPEGYEFTSEHKEIILGRSHSFGWKPKSGVLLLVACKIIVKDPAPRLERIRLMQGKQELAAFDGLAQPEFDKATAKDLNNALAECHRSGKSPDVGLVFRIPDEGTANPKKLAIEMEWQNEEGKMLSGKYSLGAVPHLHDDRPDPDAGKQSADTKPVTLDGEWTLRCRTRLHATGDATSGGNGD